MKKYTFLSTELVRKLIVLNLIILVLGFYSSFLIILLFTLVIFFIFRRRRRLVNDITIPDQSIVLSPVTGRLISIRKSSTHTSLIFKTGLFTGAGFYLPLSAEIVSYQEKVESHGNILKPYLTEIEFEDKSKNSFIILSNTIHRALRPVSLVQSGDKGRIGANLGYMMLGGKLTLEIPKNCDVIVEKNERVISSQTVIAKIKEL